MDSNSQLIRCRNKLDEKMKEFDREASARARKMAEKIEHIERLENDIKLNQKDMDINSEEIARLKEKHNVYQNIKKKKSVDLDKVKAEKVFLEKKTDGETAVSDKGGNTDFLSFIEESIKEKENELECPVCLEIARVPIFMCGDSHLVCSTCLPQLSACPECRKPYPRNPKRHRYAEKLVDEIKKLETKRNNVLESSTNKKSTEDDKEDNVPLCKSFIVSNIPYATSEEELVNFISEHGNIASISWQIQSKSQKKKKIKTAKLIFEDYVTLKSSLNFKELFKVT